ncbi:non-heme iron oxygenase ferredoxin subunit [Nostocoides vanveenii]|uniref:Non-heme iron oxygenase ferredoxin subunit n=1 Tax=Nostocoides vanveenii TaxID=330835 RepID=A0ABP4WDP2_9MICO
MSAQAHTEELVPLTVCRLDELPAVGPVKAEINGHAIAIVHAEDGAVYAIDDVCTHANVSLSEGELDGCHLECWLHGSRFDIRTGEPDCLPATVPVATYPVAIEDGDVVISIPESFVIDTES